MITVRTIEVRAARQLRHLLLRPHQEPWEIVFDGDDEADTAHLGAFEDEELVELLRLDDLVDNQIIAHIETLVARLMSYRVVTMQAKGLIPNHEASMTKLFASELNQRISRTGIKVLGLYGQLYGKGAPMKGRYENTYMTSLSSTIAGGTSEIQRCSKKPASDWISQPPSKRAGL